MSERAHVPCGCRNWSPNLAESCGGSAACSSPVFSMEHSFVIEPARPHSWALVSLFTKGRDATADGFDQMNRA